MEEIPYFEFYQDPKPLNMDVERARRHFHKGFNFKASIPLTISLSFDEKDLSSMAATFIFFNRKESE